MTAHEKKKKNLSFSHFKLLLIYYYYTSINNTFGQCIMRRTMTSPKYYVECFQMSAHV